jgi:hypothetical protein
LDHWKSKIHKTVEDDDHDLPLIKNQNTAMTNEVLSDEDKVKSDVNERDYNQFKSLKFGLILK